ncbi:hypothetical protein [Actinomadura litoris]|uniref:Uncharacterized protein n=1 Tax=Actinomadura litoris TaxID=2678616 RepID=A0A7K1L5R0_9ACTN|nr:hypothetical protein [Actinomadura litoris]MUN39595.1 hypothetical protein [Actinomadura litoris]
MMEIQEREPASWRLRRWAAPVVLAVLVAASIAVTGLLVDDTPAQKSDSTAYRTPRFEVTVGHDAGGEPGVWFQVHRPGRYWPGFVDAVEPPPAVGEAREIRAGPGGTFLVASSRAEPCESRLHRFRLTGDGHVTGLAPVAGDAVPGLLAGLAISPDGRRAAFATAPCEGGLRPASRPRAVLTVVDLGSGRRRGWDAPEGSIIGEIVWARDSRTVGYTLGDVPAGTIRNLVVRALDTGDAGTDLRGGRVLFRPPADAGRISFVMMAPDGRTGYGLAHKADRTTQTTILFGFTEGEPMRVTETWQSKPNVGIGVAVTGDDTARYACLNGIDAFGRAPEGVYSAQDRLGLCRAALVY